MHPADERRNRLFSLAVCAGLALAIAVVYAQTLRFDFLLYDDTDYVSENPNVQLGLKLAAIQWALKAVVLGNWTPVTMLSHQFVCQFFGLNAGMHHVFSVVIHILASIFLFLALRRLTGRDMASLFAAAIFALHPLHVESVAWVAERKDVLSAFFLFLAMYWYAFYVEKGGFKWYFGVLCAFALGLMSKPMLVTFPFILLMLDVWPLRRSNWPKTLYEKLPFFALSIACSWVTYSVQRTIGAVQPWSLGVRAENALISYITYLVQTLWPAHLAVFYPFPKSISLGEAMLAGAAVIAISAAAVATVNRIPYFAFGWFWYVGTLVPVIGFVQVGSQAHADRYMYIPMVGLLFALAWGADDLVQRAPGMKTAVAVLGVGAAGLCLWRGAGETAYWRNSGALFQRAIEVTQENWLAEGIFGQYLMSQAGRRPEAVEHLEAALRIEPNDAEAENNLGISLIESGLCSEAVPHLEAAARAKPWAVPPLNNLGVCLMQSGDYAGAVPYFESALQRKPDSADIHLNLGASLAKIPSRRAEAVPHLQAVLRMRPNYAEAHFVLGMLLADLGRNGEAIEQLEAGARLHPDAGIAETIRKLSLAKRP